MGHIHRAPHVRQLHGVGGVLNGGLRAHQLGKAVQSRKAVGEHLREVGQLSDGADEGGDVQGKRDKVHIVHALLHDEPAAHGDHRHRQDVGEKLHHGGEEAHLLVEAALGGLEHLVGLVEPLLLGVLVGEGLGGADAGQAGLDGGVDNAGLLLGGAGGGAHLLPAAQRRQQQHRQHHQQHQRQLPTDAEHHHQRAHDGHKGDEQILRSVVGQLGHLEQVAGQAAHQLSGTVLVIEVKAQLLHVVVQVAADVGLHPDAEGVAPVGHHEVQAGAHHIRRHHRRHHDEEHPELLFRQPCVQRGAGHQWKRQIHHGDKERAGHIQREQPPVGLKIGQEYPQQAAGLEIFCRHISPRSISHIQLGIVPHLRRPRKACPPCRSCTAFPVFLLRKG